MRIPVPRNRLVALTLLGVALTGILSLALASPAVIPSTDNSDGQNHIEQDAPSPNPDFTPDVQSQQSDHKEHEEYGEYEEHEEYDEHDDRDDHEYEEHDDD